MDGADGSDASPFCPRWMKFSIASTLSRERRTTATTARSVLRGPQRPQHTGDRLRHGWPHPDWLGRSGAQGSEAEVLQRQAALQAMPVRMLSEGRLAPGDATVIFAKGHNRKALKKAKLSRAA